MKRINLNNTVSVKLTQTGIAVLNTHLANWAERFNADGLAYTYRPAPDEQGYYTFQFWELLRIFGPSYSPATDLMDMNILINESDIETYDIREEHSPGSR